MCDGIHIVLYEQYEEGEYGMCGVNIPGAGRYTSTFNCRQIIIVF